jgi:hypothetical protein
LRLRRQQLGRAPAEWTDLRTVVLVGDLAGPVVELELLQLREDAVALLGGRERDVGRDDRRWRLVPTEKRDRDEDDGCRRQKRAEQELRAHARASDSRPP